MDTFSLKDRTIVVTGAAGILGTEFCLALIGHGANVAAIDASGEALDTLTAKISSERLKTFHADIRDKRMLASIHEDIRKTWGEVSGLLNNAGSKSPNFFEPFETFPIEDWDHVMSVNVTGAVTCAQEFGSAMAKNGRGSIVNILSIYGIVAPDQRIYEGSLYEGRTINTPAVYSASKAGLWGLTMYLSSYWAAKGVRVNAITPGGVYSGQNETFQQRYSARVPMGRMGKPDEMAGALVYLMSDAANYVTGQNITVDGGLMVW